MYIIQTVVPKLKKASFYSFSALMALSALFVVAQAQTVNAASLNQVFVRFDHMQALSPTTGTVCAKPATATAAASVQVTFPTGYTVSTTLTNWSTSTTNLGWPAGATAWLGINTATAAAGQVVTFPSTSLAVGTLYCFNWTNSAAVSVKSGTSANNSGTVTTRDVGTATIDSSTYSTASLTADQIGVSASVPQSFNFALSATTSDALGSLSTGSVTPSPTPRTATVNTNAASGWSVWAQDTYTGLKSSTAGNYTIASTTPGTNSTLSAASEGYNTGVTTSQVGGTGTISVAAPFVGGVLGKGGGLDTSLRTLATSTGTANTAVLTLTNNASIGTLTPAATDYADTITVVGAALF